MIEIEGSREIYIFKGSELVTRHANGDLSIWDIHAPEYEVKLRNPDHLQPEKCQAVVLRDNIVIIIRLTTFEIINGNGVQTPSVWPSGHSFQCLGTTTGP